MHLAPAFDSDQTATELDQLANRRGTPAHLRCDNGPELTAHALRDWCHYSRTETAFIEPGSPWQNCSTTSKFSLIAEPPSSVCSRGACGLQRERERDRTRGAGGVTQRNGRAHRDSGAAA
jgi:hypothetical protein